MCMCVPSPPPTPLHSRFTSTTNPQASVSERKGEKGEEKKKLLFPASLHSCRHHCLCVCLTTTPSYLFVNVCIIHPSCAHCPISASAAASAQSDYGTCTQTHTELLCVQRKEERGVYDGLKHTTPQHSTAHTRKRQTRLGSARLGSRASCLILLPLQFCHHPQQQQQQQHWQSGRKSCARS